MTVTTVEIVADPSPADVHLAWWSPAAPIARSTPYVLSHLLPTVRRVPRPRLLDLFCGGGGAAVGYARAGFEVVGVDLVPQPDYPFEFHRANALAFPSSDST